VVVLILYIGVSINCEIGISIVNDIIEPFVVTSSLNELPGIITL